MFYFSVLLLLYCCCVVVVVVCCLFFTLSHKNKLKLTKISAMGKSIKLYWFGRIAELLEPVSDRLWVALHPSHICLNLQNGLFKYLACDIFHFALVRLVKALHFVQLVLSVVLREDGRDESLNGKRNADVALKKKLLLLYLCWSE